MILWSHLKKIAAIEMSTRVNIVKQKN